MIFSNLWAFFLFIPLLAALIYQLRYGARRRSRLYFPSDHWYDKRPRFKLPSPFRLQLFLRFTTLSLLIFAIARPQLISTKTKRKVDVIDILISFDLSKSMDALDFKPNRREVAIETISRFIDKRADDRIGLVLFSGEAYLSTPVTTDHNLLKKNIVKSTSSNLQQGTAIGQSLAVGINHLKSSKAKSRIIILITDGDNNMGSVDPETAAQIAKGFGIKIYTIGIGKKGRVPFPDAYIDNFGRKREIMRYLNDAVDDELLKRVASRTGGSFYKAEKEETLQEIFETIDQLEKSEVEVTKNVSRSEEAWPFLMWALIFFLIEFTLLNTRWRKIP